LFFACGENPYFMAFMQADADNGIPTYTVTFDANGGLWGGGITQLTKTTGNGTIGSNMPVSPVNSDSTLICWKTVRDNGGSGTVFSNTTPVSGNITVYAQWSQNSPVQPEPELEPEPEVLIRIEAMSDKNIYSFNEAFSITVNAYYSGSDTPRPITGWTSDPENITGTTGYDVTVVISYTSEGGTKTTNFKITVDAIMIGDGGAGGDPSTVFNLTSFVTAPVLGETPATTASNTSPYYRIESIVWYNYDDGSSFNGAAFAQRTEYIAVVTLTPKTGYTFFGIMPDVFIHIAADNVVYDANTGIVTIVFPATAMDEAPPDG
jgi:hypothetical protein